MNRRTRRSRLKRTVEAAMESGEKVVIVTKTGDRYSGKVIWPLLDTINLQADGTHAIPLAELAWVETPA